MGVRNPLPGIIKIYISENNNSRFLALSRGNFVCLLQIFSAPFARLLSHLTRMKSTCTIIRHFRSTSLQIALEISRLCIVHILSTPVQSTTFFFVKPPTYIPVHPDLSESVKSTNVCTKNLQKSFRFSAIL